MSNCSTTTTTTCYPCQSSVDCDCPYGVVDAGCVQYTGDDLENFDINSGDYLDDILQKLDNFIFAETEFDANSTDSIIGTTGGTNGHSPLYDVRIDPDDDNALTVSALGLMVNTNDFGDGKVKVDSSDIKDYLEDQLLPGTDGIVTITPTTIGGVIYMIPSIDISALLDYIKIHYTTKLCEMVQECIPEIGGCVGYILTNLTGFSFIYSYLGCDEEIVGPISLGAGDSSEVFCAAEGSVQVDAVGLSDYLLAVVDDYVCPTTTTTTTTTTTSTSTTTTTTMEESSFGVQNKSQSFYNMMVYLQDDVSSLFYVIDTTVNGQISSYTYMPLSSTGTVTIQQTVPTIPMSYGVVITIDDVVVYDDIQIVGNLVIPGLDTSGGTSMVVLIYATVDGTTSTTTTTTTG